MHWAIPMVLAVLVQGGDPWADWSDQVEYGEGAGYGQEYYPENILGPPDPEATPEVPSSSPQELLTLGEEGWVVLEFTDNLVVDGQGVDFTVFENVMLLGGGGYFRECAFVEVSQDGESWSRFPWDPVTLEGLAGVWPTTGDDPTDPDVSGGDQFDIADLGLPWITHVRLVDCGTEVSDGGLFDLDAVVAVNWESGVEVAEEPCRPPMRAVSPFGVSLRLELGVNGALELYSMDGRLLLQSQADSGPCLLRTDNLAPGCYLLVLRPEGSGAPVSLKVVRLQERR